MKRPTPSLRLRRETLREFSPSTLEDQQLERAQGGTGQATAICAGDPDATGGTGKNE